jgi:hypothetical protein
MAAVSPFNVDPEKEPFNIPEQLSLDNAQKAMLAVHPYLLAISVVILVVGGFYSGVVAPIFRLLKVKFFTEGYAHGPHTSTVILSALTAFGLPGITIAIWQLAFKERQFFDATWYFFNYWSNDARYIMPAYLFWYIYGNYLFFLTLCIIFFLLARWKPLPTEITPCSDRHGFIIVAHNSTRKLDETIKAILKFARPHQIFIADNGSSEDEKISTRALCNKLSDGDSRIRLAHLRYGNKTLAQYACVFDLVRRFDEGTSPIDLVTLIDDDVMIPATFPSKDVEKLFDNPAKIAVAYPLRVANPEKSACAAFQDCEYLIGNVLRYIQDLLGSQLFCSGAMATWKIHPLQKVLERHCTAFNGEDLEMGYVLHKLCDRKTDKLNVENPVCIGYVRNCIVPTIAPICSLHWYDLIPAALKRKWNVKSCSCGEHSFFNQRLRSWDPASHQFFFKLIRVIFSRRGATFGPNLFVRVLCAWKIINLLREYVFVVGIIASLVQLSSVNGFVNLLVFYADAIVVSWGLGILANWTQSLSTSRMGLALREDVLFFQPLLFEMPYFLIIRVMGIMYCFTYYLFFQRFPNDIRTQMDKDPEKAECIRNAWKDEY